jgi:hypothetical protein
MTSQHDLIARKHEVRGRIERTRRALAQEQSRGEQASRRRVRKLEDELEKLMAEEYRLRLSIDQRR